MGRDVKMRCVLWPQKHSKNKEKGGDFLAPKGQLSPSPSGSMQWWSDGTEDVVLSYRQDRISPEVHQDAVWSLTSFHAAQPRRKQNLTAQPVWQRMMHREARWCSCSRNPNRERCLEWNSECDIHSVILWHRLHLAGQRGARYSTDTAGRHSPVLCRRDCSHSQNAPANLRREIHCS